MPLFKPFKGIRAKSEFIKDFATSPIEKLPKDELGKPAPEVSFLAMVKPLISDKAEENVDRNLHKVRSNFEEMLRNKSLSQDNSCIYLYSQILPDKSFFRGLLGLTSAEDFIKGKIKKHETTLAKRKENYAYYLDKVELQTEPVLLTYPANSKLEVMMDYEEKSIPIINYTDKSGITHKVWKIDSRLTIKQFKDVFEEIDAFYIADGHHRIGSIAINAKNRKSKDKNFIGTEPYNFVYSYVISNNSIKIHDYNRVLKDLNGLTKKEFLKKLEDYFIIHEKGDIPYYPTQKHHIGMYIDKKFYSLHIKHELRSKEEGLKSLDHYFLDQNVFKNILNISNTKHTGKIGFVSGNSTKEGLNKIIDLVDSNQYEIGFIIYPISYTDLIQTSDLGQKMPPKCTYIEPKLLTGLIMYDMK